MESAISGTVLPTLDELVAHMAEVESQTDATGKKLNRTSAGAASDFNLWANASRESMGSIQAGLQATAETAQIAADEVAAAAQTGS